MDAFAICVIFSHNLKQRKMRWRLTSMEDEIRMYASSDFDGTPTNVEDKPAQDVELEDEEEEISENSVDTGVDEPSPIAPPERESYAELAPVKAAVKPVVKRARKAPRSE